MSASENDTDLLFTEQDSGPSSGAQPGGAVEPLPSARRPVGALAAAPFGVLTALLVLGGGVLLVQSVLAANNIVHVSWVHELRTRLTGLTPLAWMAPVGVVVALIGLWLIWLALAPRRSNRTALRSEVVDSWIAPAGVARIASGAARDVPGVLDARSTASTRAVTVTATVTGDEQALRERVERTVTDRLSALATAPTVTVRTRGGSV